jgi:hypothetical protein
MQEKITFHRAALISLRTAYLALADGGVQSYSIGSRSLTKFDLAKISEEIANHEKAINEISALMNGRSRRKAVGIVPRDW